MKKINLMRNSFSFCVIFLFLLIMPCSALSIESVCARVKIEIRQEMTFVRQAFDAHMGINNGLTTVPLEDINVDVLFSDEEGSPVLASSNPDDPNALFFIRIDSMEGVDDVTGDGTVAPASTADIHWLIIPAPASVENAPQGKLYYVGARLTYTINGEEHVTVVTPDYINVRPLPSLTLDYFLPDEVYGDDPFTTETEESIPFSLGVRIANNGQGVAQDVKINSAQPKIVENDQGLLVDFLIVGSEVNGITAPDTLLLEFGDIDPGASTIGRWLMTCSLSGRFVEFDAEYSHADELGGELTSLIENVSTHFLVHDVLVDVPGRDTIRDFLGKDDDIYRVYESDAGVTEVHDLSAQAQVNEEQNNGSEVVYTITIPPTAGFVYFKISDPQQGNKVISNIVRSDGKILKSENAWLFKKRIDADWTYSAGFFDYNTTGIYTLTLVDPSLLNHAPEFNEQDDPVGKEGEELTFIIDVTDPDNQTQQQSPLMSRSFMEMERDAADSGNDEGISISAGRLPVGAELVDLGDGRAMIRWTPQIGQAGSYPITLTATDGELTTTTRYHLTVTGAMNVPTAQFSANPTNCQALQPVQFTDTSLSEDGIKSWLWDFGDGQSSEEQNPSHVYEQAGNYTVSLTVTEIDGDQQTATVSHYITVTEAVNSLKIEYGRDLVNHTWSTVLLTKDFVDPVIVATVIDTGDPDPATIRIRNIENNSFEIRLQEPSNTDGIHPDSEVSYVIMEKGTYILDDGTRVVADYSYSSETGENTSVTYPEPFTVVPIVISSVTSETDQNSAWIALKNIGTSDFTFQVQEEEGASQSHGSERVDFIAWEPSSGLVGNTLFEVGPVENVNQSWKRLYFSNTFNVKPFVVATRQSFNEQDPVSVVLQFLDPFGTDMRLIEETTGDAESNHAFEQVGYISLSEIVENEDTDHDGITDSDEITIYHTHPALSDTDGDGIADGAEHTYWGDSWNEDADGDGIINLLDPDADNDGIFDGLEIEQGTDPADADSVIAGILYEDAEDGDISGWQIYDNDPAGAVITNVVDHDRNSRVIEFSGSGTGNGYRLRNPDGSWWNNGAHKTIEWSMNYSENFVVYIAVQTTDGFRYLYYTAADHDNLGTDKYIHHGLGSSIRDGNWHTIIRDLEYDLKEAQPDNNIEAILGFLIRGSGRIDNIRSMESFPVNYDTDQDGITDLEERNTYNTNPYVADTDGDGIADGAEHTYWGDSWNEDADGDGIINLLDPDADNDGIFDGLEIEQGTDPADADSVIAGILYEDAEDGDISGWQIYDNDPAGAVITNVVDHDRNSRVIEFSGSGTGNGYRLRNPDGSWWNNGAHKTIEWSMNYSENFVVYIAVQTTDGFRYLYYTAADHDNLGTDKYIHHGLGSSIRDGNWHTIIRDLEYDLKEAQSDNNLLQVQGFYIKGSGRIDDITLKNE